MTRVDPSPEGANPFGNLDDIRHAVRMMICATFTQCCGMTKDEPLGRNPGLTLAAAAASTPGP